MKRSTFLNLSGRTALVAVMASLLGACASIPAPTTVAATIAQTPSLSTLNGLVKSAGLTETLNGTGPFTVFAPSNEAFKAVPAKTMEVLAKDPMTLKSVLTYHVMSGKSTSTSIKNSKATTMNGAEVELSRAGDMITIESAVVTQADLAASNGVVHIIDTVLIPPVKK